MNVINFDTGAFIEMLRKVNNIALHRRMLEYEENSCNWKYSVKRFKISS
jgi:hypothetical protein